MKTVNVTSIDKLELMLKGEIFHVSCACSRKGIENAGAIMTNQSGQFQGGWSTKNGEIVSFARKHGYVSLVDFKNPSQDEIEDALDFFNPFRASRCLERDEKYSYLKYDCYVLKGDCDLRIWNKEALVKRHGAIDGKFVVDLEVLVESKIFLSNFKKMIRLESKVREVKHEVDSDTIKMLKGRMSKANINNGLTLG